jgi:hypothetical protein
MALVAVAVLDNPILMGMALAFIGTAVVYAAP